MTDKMEEALRRISGLKMPADLSATSHDLIEAIQIARDALPQPLEVGEVVRRTVDLSGMGEVTILCIHREKAWCRDRFGGAVTVPLSNLERV